MPPCIENGFPTYASRPFSSPDVTALRYCVVTLNRFEYIQILLTLCPSIIYYYIKRVCLIIFAIKLVFVLTTLAVYNVNSAVIIDLL
jgi:hypothetical protein